MRERLRAGDLALMAAESPTTPMHNATLEIFEPASTFDYAGLLELVADRIAFVPRYRQCLQSVPGWLANPVWIDDPDFDLSYHVRRAALPMPGTMEQLMDLVARIVSRPLDPSRPLWEAYFVEGVEGGRVALLTKSHQLLVDGVETVDLGQVLLDIDPSPRRLEADDWEPQPRTSLPGLVLDAVRDTVTDPATLWHTGLSRAEALWRISTQLTARMGRSLGGFSTGPDSPLSGKVSMQRRVVGVRTDLADYRAIRAEHGGTVNDVILATVAGALRAWLITRGRTLGELRQLRTVVPMSVRDADLEPTSLGAQVQPHYVDLPIGEVSPVVRLHQVSYSFRAHRETGRAVSARRLVGIDGFAPTTFHALGSRVVANELPRGFDLSVTNVPGPQFPLYATDAQMVETYPVPPLMSGRGLSIGVTSYDGSVYYGLTGDRLLLPDLDILGQCLTEALEELLETASAARPKAPRRRGPAGSSATRRSTRSS